MKPALDDRGVLVPCASCGSSNRLAYATLNKRTRCGKCKTAIAAPNTPIEASSSAHFNAAAAHSVLPLLVDFWAAWCGPCRMVAPELAKVAQARAGEWLVVKVDTESLTDVADRYRIQSLPTLAVVHHGAELQRTAGVRPAAEIESFAVAAIAASSRRAS